MPDAPNRYYPGNVHRLMLASRLSAPDGGHKSFGIYLTTGFLPEEIPPDIGHVGDTQCTGLYSLSNDTVRSRGRGIGCYNLNLLNEQQYTNITRLRDYARST